MKNYVGQRIWWKIQQKTLTQFDPHLLVTHLSLWQSPFLKHMLNNLTIYLKQLMSHSVHHVVHLPRFKTFLVCMDCVNFSGINSIMKVCRPNSKTYAGGLHVNFLTLTCECLWLFTFFFVVMKIPLKPPSSAISEMQ